MQNYLIIIFYAMRASQVAQGHSIKGKKETIGINCNK